MYGKRVGKNHLPNRVALTALSMTDAMIEPLVLSACPCMSVFVFDSLSLSVSLTLFQQPHTGWVLRRSKSPMGFFLSL